MSFWGPPGGLGIGVGEKYFAYPSELRSEFLTIFLVSRTNMSPCLKYQEPGEGVGVGFSHSCHSVKRSQNHFGFLEYMQDPSCVKAGMFIISYSVNRPPPHLQVNLPQGVSNQIDFTVHTGCARVTQRDKHVDTSRHVFPANLSTCHFCCLRAHVLCGW